VGGNSGAFSNVFASKVTITESSSVTVTSLSCNFGGISGPIRAAIYADSAAAPSTLIVESNVINLEGHFDWTQLDIPDTVLAPGTYWLALQTLQGSSLTFTLYDTGAGNIMAQSNNYTFGPFPSSFSVGLYHPFLLSLVANYCKP
jgi:hypothetical protein